MEVPSTLTCAISDAAVVAAAGVRALGSVVLSAGRAVIVGLVLHGFFLGAVLAATVWCFAGGGALGAGVAASAIVVLHVSVFLPFVLLGAATIGAGLGILRADLCTLLVRIALSMGRPGASEDADKLSFQELQRALPGLIETACDRLKQNQGAGCFARIRRRFTSVVLRRVCRAMLRHLQLHPGPNGEVHASVENWLGAELDRRVSGTLAAVAARNISMTLVVEGGAAALIIAGTRTLLGPASMQAATALSF